MEALLEAALRLATPLLLAALGELLVERAGMVNIGTEGTMLFGAFAGFALAFATGSPALGALAGLGVGAAVGAAFAFFSVTRAIDQIVVGTAINLLALGGTGVAARAFYAGGVPSGPTFAGLDLLGGGLSVYTPLAVSLAIAIGIFFARTRPGLRWRAVGESARAADVEGARVARLRWVAALSGGALAGLAGSSLSLVQSNTFTEGMTAGRGFIALAIVIFGRWNAAGLVAAALFFGFASAGGHRLQARGSDLPYQFALMFPYLVTLLVLAFASRRARAPADLGRVYQRS